MAGLSVPVDQVLPPGVQFFDPNAGKQVLDRRIVLRLPAGSIRHLNPYALEEAVTRMVLLKPTDQEVDAFVAQSAKAGLVLIPHSLAESQHERYRNTLTTATMYVAGALAFLALVFLAFFSSASDVVERESRTFAVRRLHGATDVDIAIRIGAFLASVLIVAPVTTLGLLMLVMGPAGEGVPWAIAVIVAIYLFLWLRMTHKVVNRDPTLLGR